MECSVGIIGESRSTFIVTSTDVSKLHELLESICLLDLYAAGPTSSQKVTIAAVLLKDRYRLLFQKPILKNMNAKIEETVHFSALNTSHEFLNYLQKNALIVDLWGLQVDHPKTVIAKGIGLGTANQISELYPKLLKLEEETELLRDINRALREENVFLKDKLKKWETGRHESKKLKSPNKRAVKVTKQPVSSKEAGQMCNHRMSYNAEFAKAVKVFYQNTNIVRQQFLKLKHNKPPVCMIFIQSFQK
nr:kinesin-like protein KIF28P [Pelodiscus sinensis]|eukprot:XP_025046601.1 kinesin-like protein KIF28P [Pelodiscus sinensis]